MEEEEKKRERKNEARKRASGLLLSASQVEKEAILWPTGTHRYTLDTTLVCVCVIHAGKEEGKKWEWRALQHTASPSGKNVSRGRRRSQQLIEEGIPHSKRSETSKKKNKIK